MGSATILTRFGEDKYPIGRFISDRARALGISRSDLVRRLGYRDVSGGHKALSTALLTGVMAPQIEHHLASALEVGECSTRAVIEATRRQKDDEAGRSRIQSEQAYSNSFRPHLQVQTERRVPSPIFVAALLTVAPAGRGGCSRGGDPRPHRQDHHPRPLARNWRACSSLRRDHGLRPGRDCGIRRFRLRPAVQYYWRSNRGNAGCRATWGGEFGNKGR